MDRQLEDVMTDVNTQERAPRIAMSRDDAAPSRCHVCQAEAPYALRKIRSPYLPLHYTLYRCPACRCRTFDLLENGDVDLKDFYDSRAIDSVCLRAEFKVSPRWRHEVSEIRSCREAEVASVLDVGCRTGDFLMHWPSEVARCGVELSAEAAAVANQRDLDVRQAYIEDVEFSHSFDVVSCYALLEHLAEPTRFLDRLSALVSEGGVLVIMIPTFQSLKVWLLDVLGIRWQQYQPPEHLSLFSRSFLDSYLARRGFSLRRRTYSSGGQFNPFRSVRVVRSVFSWWMQILDTTGPLRRIPVFDHMYSYYVRG